MHPRGFEPAYEGAGLCRRRTPGQVLRQPPVHAHVGRDLPAVVDAWTWRLSGFYENGAYGGVFLGTAQVVTVTSGQTQTDNLTVPYRRPAALTGTITVKNVPADDPVEDLSVLLCPSYAPYTGGGSSIACVNGYATTTTGDTGSFSLTGLPPGQWTAFSGFCLQSGCSINAKKGVAVTLVGGKTSNVNLSTDFLLSGQSLLTGTVSVVGAERLNDEVGVTACQGVGCETIYAYYTGNHFSVVLPSDVSMEAACRACQTNSVFKRRPTRSSSLASRSRRAPTSPLPSAGPGHGHGPRRRRPARGAPSTTPASCWCPWRPSDRRCARPRRMRRRLGARVGAPSYAGAGVARAAAVNTAGGRSRRGPPGVESSTTVVSSFTSPLISQLSRGLRLGRDIAIRPRWPCFPGGARTTGIFRSRLPVDADSGCRRGNGQRDRRTVQRLQCRRRGLQRTPDCDIVPG